jgi:hypothetical protein
LSHPLPPGNGTKEQVLELDSMIIFLTKLLVTTLNPENTHTEGVLATKFILNYPQMMTYNERLIKLNLLNYSVEKYLIYYFFSSPEMALYLLTLEITCVPLSNGILRVIMTLIIII